MDLMAGRREADMDFLQLMRFAWTTGPYVIHGFKSHKPESRAQS